MYIASSHPTIRIFVMPLRVLNVLHFEELQKQYNIFLHFLSTKSSIWKTVITHGKAIKGPINYILNIFEDLPFLSHTSNFKQILTTLHWRFYGLDRYLLFFIIWQKWIYNAAWY